MSEKIPDAIRSPLHYAGSGDSYSRLAKLHLEFSEILDVAKVYVRHQGAEHFVTGRPEDTLNVGSQESLAGTPRYRWEERGDGVIYGYLNRGIPVN